MLQAFPQPDTSTVVFFLLDRPYPPPLAQLVPGLLCFLEADGPVGCRTDHFKGQIYLGGGGKKAEFKLKSLQGFVFPQRQENMVLLRGISLDLSGYTA